ncbi:hypothetical protein [Candidatus Methanomassiliicoccus intestinalis]|jgi:hypothetical protein|uniref:hypothetical protein n=1 Tax=Candidatus Methanomassiliicoccus intestinalis TaxID=1406512 RepID=UPI0037DDBBFA
MELDKHQQAMIKHLFKNGRMKKSEVYTVVPTGGNRARKLDEMKSWGFVTYDIRKYENNTTFVELTEKGKMIAQRLIEIDQISEGKVPENQVL